MTARTRDLTCTYDWYIYHGTINGKRTFQFESTTSRNYYNHKLCGMNFEVNVRSTEASGDLVELNDSVQAQV